MGTVHSSIPVDIADQIRKLFSLSAFIETGTYMGTGTAWAADRFERVWTIEAYRPLYDNAVDRFRGRKNVEVIFGNSSKLLNELVGKLQNSAMFWLDGHYSGPGTAGEAHECPLLDEIAAIDRSQHEHFVLIDDARMFLAPPKPPHRVEEWPDITTVLNALHSRKPNDFVAIFEDVIYRIPQHAKAKFIELVRERKG